MKTTIAALVLLTSASAAVAYDHQPQGCGPEVELSINQNENTGGYGGSTQGLQLNAGIKWTLGQSDQCKKYNAYVQDKRLRGAREQEARAIQQETRAFEDKIRLCSQYDTTAPNSILTFCGDLIKGN